MLKEAFEMARKFRLILFLLLALTLTPLSSGRAQPSGLPVDVPRQDVFIADQIIRYTSVDNFNMWVNGVDTPNRHALLMETLWYADAETGKTVYGAAAADPVYNKDFTEMTVKLRDNIAWSDGVPFSADDLVYTVQTIMSNPKLNAWNSVLTQYVAKVEKVDNSTVKFTLKESNPRFHYNFMARWNGVYMMPKHVFEKVTGPLEDFKFNPPVSLGAYVIKQSDPNGNWDLYQRRDDWQKTSAGIIVGKPGPKYILTILYGDSSKKAIAMARGDLDVSFDFDYEAFQSLLKSTPTAQSWYKDFPWAYPGESDSRFYLFNYAKEPLFQNKDVRWALALALDIVDIQTNYVGGVVPVDALAEPATAAFSKLYHKPLKDWLANLQIEIEKGTMYKPWDPTVPQQILEWAKEQKYNVTGNPEDLFGIGWWKHDPEVAERLLIKNGFKRGPDKKWLRPDGKPWQIEILAAQDEPDAFRMAQAAQDQWKAFGIDAKSVGVERPVWDQRRFAGDFQIAVEWGSWNTSFPNGDKWQQIRCLRSNYYLDMPTAFNSNGGCVESRLKTDMFDKIIDDLAKVDPSSPEALKLNQDFVKLIAENMYEIDGLTFKKFTTFDSRYWKGFPSSDNAFGYPQYWFQIGKYVYQHLEPAK
jgi:peptide/nickel transport system substrate-binding protein